MINECTYVRAIVWQRWKIIAPADVSSWRKERYREAHMIEFSDGYLSTRTRARTLTHRTRRTVRVVIPWALVSIGRRGRSWSVSSGRETEPSRRRKWRLRRLPTVGASTKRRGERRWRRSSHTATKTSTVADNEHNSSSSKTQPINIWVADDANKKPPCADTAKVINKKFRIAGASSPAPQSSHLKVLSKRQC